MATDTVPVAFAALDSEGGSETTFTCKGVLIWDAPGAATPGEAVATYAASKGTTAEVKWIRWESDPQTMPPNVVSYRPSDSEAARTEVGASLLEVVQTSSGEWFVRGACQ